MTPYISVDFETLFLDTPSWFCNNFLYYGNIPCSDVSLFDINISTPDFYWVYFPILLFSFFLTYLCLYFWLKKNFFKFIYFRERQRQSVSRGGAERHWDPESQAVCRLWAVSTEPHAGLKPTKCEIMTWAEVGRLTSVSQPGTSVSLFLKWASLIQSSFS